ncbi:MAG: PEP-CTERM system TPR-repeat protein PrsT [Gammaproteobacteria bacterium]|nr:MAG: PEP-CTERM system TPR-repeat protein PrsT [Gammaproteobacteria bacterium]
MPEKWVGQQGFRLPVVVLAVVFGLSACDNTTAAEHLGRAQAYDANQEVNAAVIELKNALQKEPGLAAARLLLGRLYLEQGDAVSAVKELERALDLGVAANEVMPDLLRAKLGVGRYQEVLGSLDEFDALSPELDTIRGNALLQAEDLEGAQAAFERTLSGTLAGTPAADAVHGQAVLGLARIAWASEDLELAAQLLDQAVDLAPEDRQAWLTKAELHVRRSQFEDALTAYQTALGLPGPDVEARLGIARVRLVQGDVDGAEAELVDVLARAPDYPPANYLQGLVAFQRQDFDLAESALLKVQRVAPSHAPTLFLMGTVKYHKQQYAQSRDLLNRYLSGDPRNVAARKLLAAMSLKEGDARTAIESLAPIAADLQDPQALALLGSAYLRNGDTSRATEYLGRAADQAPDVAALRTQLALSLLAAGDKDSAVAELRAAVEMDGDLIQSEVLLVLVHLRAKEFEQALAGAEAMVAARPDDPVGHNLKGAALLGLERAAEGEAALGAALAADPSYTPAATNLARIAIQRGDRAAAVVHYQALLAADPGNLQARMGLAEIAAAAEDREAAITHLLAARLDHPQAFAPRLVLARLAVLGGDLPAADEYIEEAVTIAPNRSDVLLLAASIDVDTGAMESARRRVNVLHEQLEGGEGAANVHLSLAAMQQRLGQPERARRNFEYSLARDPESNAARAGLTRLDIGAGNFERAKSSIEALGNAGWNAPVLSLLEGDLAVAEDRVDEALPYYRSAAGAGVREAALKLASRLSAAGDHDAAATSARAWLAEHPNDGGLQLVLANSLLQTSDHTGAIGIYEAMDAQIDNPVVLNNLAWLYMEQNDQRALATAERAYELAPDSGEIADTLGWILVNQGSGARGLRHLERAAAKLPDNGSVLFHLGMAHKQLGDAAAARSSLQAALRSGSFPERDSAQRELSELAELAELES